MPHPPFAGFHRQVNAHDAWVADLPVKIENGLFIEIVHSEWNPGIDMQFYNGDRRWCDDFDANDPFKLREVGFQVCKDCLNLGVDIGDPWVPIQNARIDSRIYIAILDCDSAGATAIEFYLSLQQFHQILYSFKPKHPTLEIQVRSVWNLVNAFFQVFFDSGFEKRRLLLSELSLVCLIRVDVNRFSALTMNSLPFHHEQRLSLLVFLLGLTFSRVTLQPQK